MEPADWDDPQGRTIGMMIFGSAADEVDARGRTVRGDTVLLLMNAGPRSRSYQLPETGHPGIWEERFNTALPFNAVQARRRVERRGTVNLAAHSTILLRRVERGGS
jgi:glycogen operon protein